MELIKSIIADHNELVKSLTDEFCTSVTAVSDIAIQSIENGSKILICGNGGSAADSQHMAAELVNRFLIDRQPFPAIALSTDTSIITSVSNDYSFNDVFAKQVVALGGKGDVLIGISTSGNSLNVLKAVSAAKQKSMVTAVLTGASPNKLCAEADYCIDVPSKETPRIQEIHSVVIHILCELIEKKICSS